MSFPKVGHSWVVHFWWKRLWQDPSFVQEAKSRWIELRAGLLSDEAVFDLVDSLLSVVQPAANRNFTRWPVLEEHIWPNNFVGGTFPAEINYLKDWLEDRLGWMDGAIETLVTATATTPNIAKRVRVIPNPNSGSFQFSIRSKLAGQGIIKLYDTFGRAIGQKDTGWLRPEVENVIPWDQQLVRGMYYFTISQNEQVIGKGKVLIR